MPIAGHRPFASDRTQSVHVQLGVDHGRTPRPMPKHVADLGKRCAPAHHIGREAVPQDVGANVSRRWFQIGLLERVFQNLVEDLRIDKGHVRRAMLDKQRA